jgi:hypothetical protein
MIAIGTLAWVGADRYWMTTIVALVSFGVVCIVLGLVETARYWKRPRAATRDLAVRPART